MKHLDVLADAKLSVARRRGASSCVAFTRPRPWRTPCCWAAAPSPGRNSSIALPPLWRKIVLSPAPTPSPGQALPQTSSSMRGGKSLRRVDRPPENREMVRADTGPVTKAEIDLRVGDVHHRLQHGRRRASRSRRHLSRSGAEPAAGLHLGLHTMKEREFALVTPHQTRRRRVDADAAAREVSRSRRDGHSRGRPALARQA